MSGRQMAAHAGCHGQRTQEARAGRAIGFCRSSNARTNAVAASARRGPRPRQRRISPRCLPWQTTRVLSSQPHPGVADESACRDVWLRPLLVPVWCAPLMEPGTTSAAKPSRMARSLGPHVDVSQRGKHRRAFDAGREGKRRITTRQEATHKKIAARPTRRPDCVFVRRFDSVRATCDGSA